MNLCQDQITECILRAGNDRDMLVLVVGSSRHGNSAYPRTMAMSKKLHYLPPGAPLAHRLTDIPTTRRPMALEAIVSEIPDGSESSRVCVDHTETLF